MRIPSKHTYWKRTLSVAQRLCHRPTGHRRADDLRQRGRPRPEHRWWLGSRSDQARLAHHLGEQVLRRDLHRPQQQLVPLADPPVRGRPAEELLRHRPHQPGQLHRAGLGPGSPGRHPERLRTINSPFSSNSNIITTGAVGGDTNWTYGQALSLLGANAPPGTTPANTNGCTYPTEIPTLFDQFNAAGVSWKGYAQDLGGAQPIGSTSFVSDSVPDREDAACGAPGTSTSNNPVSNPRLHERLCRASRRT